MLCPDCHNYNGRSDNSSGQCESCAIHARLVAKWKCLRCRETLKENEDIICHQCEEGWDIC